MYTPRLSLLVATAATVTALWGTTATAQTIQPIIKLAPDLVVTTIGLDCTGVRVVVKNTGDAVLRITSPIVVRINALIGIESGARIFDKALSATSLSSGQTETVNFLLAGAPGFLAVTATADANSSLTESNETNNERRTLDEQTCPLLTVNDASIAEGGDVVFTATINRRPTRDASFSWASSPASAIGGAACGGLVDFLTASGTVTFLASEPVPTPRTMRIKTCSDVVNEPSEVLRLAVSSLANMYFMRSSSPVGTISNQAIQIRK